MSLPGWTRALWHLAVVAAGRCAARVKLCRVWIGSDGYFHKQRKPLSGCWVGPLNLALRLLGIPVEVLPESEWLRREQDVLGRVLGRAVRVQGSVLLTPRLPGRCLWRLVRQQPEQAWPALEAAARALYQLHEAGVTHSDPALHNAFYDPADGTAHWLDFETRYLSRTRVDRCRSHDLAALLASAAKATPRSHLPQVVEAIARGYPHRARLEQAGRLLGRLPVLLIVEVPWSLGCLDSLRGLLLRAAPGPTAALRREPGG